MTPRGAPPHTVESGPIRVGNEQRWRVKLDDGRPAVLAMLLAELARDPSLRRRYVGDAERLAGLDAPALAPTIAVGPPPDPRAADAEPPWRLRLDPAGETLEHWLAERAPAPLDEALDLGARLADALHDLHRRGAVLRDLRPTQIVLGDDGKLWLTDVGLARLDLLSSRTASSLFIEGSPYAAPEFLRSPIVDSRADLYSLGVILWRALTGTLPFGDAPAFLRERKPLPPLADLRAGLPSGAAEIVRRCLADKIDERPDGARAVAAVLRGGAAPGTSLERVRCQACGATLRSGLRLCLACGKEAVQLGHTDDPRTATSIDLLSVSEAQNALGPLREIALGVSEPATMPLNFLTGNPKLYSKKEAKSLIRLPTRLWSNLTPRSAEILSARLAVKGIKLRVVAQRRERIKRAVRKPAIAVMVASLIFAVAGHAPALGSILCIAALITFLFTLRRLRNDTPLLALKAAPAALPASDPLVARLAALLGKPLAPDVAERVSELALLVQRLADHRAGTAASEIDVVVAPAVPLVELVEREVRSLAKLDQELAGLDESAMVRALAASQARKEPAVTREPLLAGLDRLRGLEDQRARSLHRLLEAGALLRRSVELGLRVKDPDAEYRAQIAVAMAALDE